MSYRSSGGMVLYGDKELMLSELVRLGATRTNDNPWKDEDVSLFEYEPGRLVWILEYEWRKWYENYSDVKEFERIYEEASPELLGYKWRLGEEASDIEINHRGETQYEDCEIIVAVNHKFGESVIKENTFKELSATVLAVS